MLRRFGRWRLRHCCLSECLDPVPQNIVLFLSDVCKWFSCLRIQKIFFHHYFFLLSRLAGTNRIVASLVTNFLKKDTVWLVLEIGPLLGQVYGRKSQRDMDCASNFRAHHIVWWRVSWPTCLSATNQFVWGSIQGHSSCKFRCFQSKSK